MLGRVETAAAAIGLMANPKKTKVMTFNCPSKIDKKPVTAPYSKK